jgi:hypothetical protein
LEKQPDWLCAGLAAQKLFLLIHILLRNVASGY